jgi:hypothetical protein
MKKIIFFLALTALFSVNAKSIGRPIHGYIALITVAANDSFCFPTVCVKGGATGVKIYVQIDSIMKMNSVKIGIDQTIGLEITFAFYDSYYGYGHFRGPIPYPITSFMITNIDVFGGIDLEAVIPALIKTNLATSLGINANRITVNSYYYNYPSL